MQLELCNNKNNFNGVLSFYIVRLGLKKKKVKQVLESCL